MSELKRTNTHDQNKQNEWTIKKRGREWSTIKVSAQLLQALVHSSICGGIAFATLTQMANQIVDRQTFFLKWWRRWSCGLSREKIAAGKLWADGRFVFNFVLLPALCSFESSNTHHFQSHYHHSIDGALNLTFNAKRHRFTYSVAVSLNIKYYFIFFTKSNHRIRWWFPFILVSKWKPRICYHFVYCFRCVLMQQKKYVAFSVFDSFVWLDKTKRMEAEQREKWKRQR